MEDKLDEKRLWVALSYMFVDSEVDFKSIAEIAKDYSIEEIEFALFERVAPVCISNMLTPVPPIWWFFDEAQLVSDIDSLIEKRSRHGFFCKWVSTMAGWLMRLYCSEVWAHLKAEVENKKSNI